MPKYFSPLNLSHFWIRGQWGAAPPEVLWNSHPCNIFKPVVEEDKFIGSLKCRPTAGRTVHWGEVIPRDKLPTAEITYECEAPFALYDVLFARTNQRGDGGIMPGYNPGGWEQTSYGALSGNPAVQGAGGVPPVAGGMPWAMAAQAIGGAIDLMDARSRARTNRMLAREFNETTHAGIRANHESNQAQLAEAALAQMSSLNVGRGMGRSVEAVGGAVSVVARREFGAVAVADGGRQGGGKFAVLCHDDGD